MRCHFQLLKIDSGRLIKLPFALKWPKISLYLSLARVLSSAIYLKCLKGERMKWGGVSNSLGGWHYTPAPPPDSLFARLCSFPHYLHIWTSFKQLSYCLSVFFLNCGLFSHISLPLRWVLFRLLLYQLLPRQETVTLIFSPLHLIENTQTINFTSCHVT